MFMGTCSNIPHLYNTLLFEVCFGFIGLLSAWRQAGQKGKERGTCDKGLWWNETSTFCVCVVCVLTTRSPTCSVIFSLNSCHIRLDMKGYVSLGP